MKRDHDLIFEDDHFLIRIDPARESGIDKLEDARRALHEAIEIKYFYEGTSTLLIGRKTVVAQAGDVIVINPYEFHATVDYGKEKGKYHLFMISPDFFSEFETELSELRHRLLSGQISFTTLIQNDERLCHVLSLAAEEIQKKAPHYRLALRGLVMELFAHLMRIGIQNAPCDDARKQTAHRYRVIEPALRRIRDGYAEHLSVEELASLCAISKYHFCRIFKSVVGMTALQYINDYRLSIADTLLKNTDHTVLQVAQLCGFEDESYFCRLYKKRFGFTTGKRRSTEELP